MLYVMDRIPRRHPNISKQDVVVAWNNAIIQAPRQDGRSFECIALGFDGRGRLLELVGRRQNNGDWVIFHALTPPTAKTLRELGRERR